ncbi:hypothetical protein GALMADRAFT_266000 [Galerina marginata CBS 339.88]|uniref:Uncharacterized protein n=1 Tax=Galerina marginata (strain CBS 339.88) TaxID=685588 RepID=A0A067TBI3_GALM3|nr:hypothetical protein GALMADRAFT_266000 [Galerina marginata CBS 339.88]
MPEMKLTLILPYTYSVIGTMLTLRSLSVKNCSFGRPQTPLAPDDEPLIQITSITHQLPTDPPSPFATQPITRLPCTTQSHSSPITKTALPVPYA